jgi:hypothetical protein
MRRANFHKADLREAVQARCPNSLESSADNSMRQSGHCIPLTGVVCVPTYSATMSFAEAQPKEKAVNITHERTSRFLRPYISLNFEMQTANPASS